MYERYVVISRNSISLWFVKGATKLALQRRFSNDNFYNKTCSKYKSNMTYRFSILKIVGVHVFISLRLVEGDFKISHPVFILNRLVWIHVEWYEL